MVLLESGYEGAHFAALPGLGGYGNRAQRTLLGKRFVAANHDAVPGLHTTAQGAQRIFTLREFRRNALLRVFWRAVQGGRENGVGADVEVLLLDAIDELVFRDVCEKRGFDFCEGV